MSELMDLVIKLEKYADQISNTAIVSGFDGFIDQMISVVDERKGLSSYTSVKSMPEFASLIQEASNRNAVREIVIKSEEIGGCAVNLGDGIATLGTSLDYFGTMGTPMDKAFEDFATKCRVCIPLDCPPGKTMALEFDDGKYMLSSVSQLSRLDRELLKKSFTDNVFLNSCQSADLIALTDWTLYPHMTDCWAYVQEEILSQLTVRPFIFIDLIDPRSRSKVDIKEMIKVLTKFEKYGNTIFGGNLNEANQLASLFGIDTIDKEGEEVAVLASQIREVLEISTVTLHSVKGSALADESGSYWVYGPYCSEPKKSVGAGDRYNAGFCLATILQLEPKERLLFANATSGFFVRNGLSGSFEQIVGLIKAWDDKTLN